MPDDEEPPLELPEGGFALSTEQIEVIAHHVREMNKTFLGGG